MSIVVGVQKAGKVVIAADTMMSTGSRREHVDNLAAKSKLRRVGGAVLGGVGWSVYDNILDHYLKTKKRLPPLTTEQSIFAFFLRFWQALRRDYQVVNDQPDREDPSPFANIDSEFLVANGRGLFHVATDLSVTQFAKYVAVGSGDRYAYGVLYTAYDSRRPASQIARSAVDAAAHFDQSCGPPVEVIELNLRH